MKYVRRSYRFHIVFALWKWKWVKKDRKGKLKKKNMPWLSSRLEHIFSWWVPHKRWCNKIALCSHFKLTHTYCISCFVPFLLPTLCNKKEILQHILHSNRFSWWKMWNIIKKHWKYEHESCVALDVRFAWCFSGHNTLIYWMATEYSLNNLFLKLELRMKSNIKYISYCVLISRPFII